MRRALVLLLVLLALAAPASADPKINVLSMGDSWATQWCDALQNVILAHGNLVEVWDYGIYGSTSTIWAAPGAMLPVLAELVTHPEIDWVLVSLGGNDLLDGYLLGGYGDALFPIVEADVRIVIDQLLAVRPDLKIAYNGYDFPNFIHTTECILLGQLYLGGDVFFQNTLFAELTEISEDIAADYPQVTAVNLLGTLQAAGGYPNPPNFYLPSPPDFFPGDECIHPTGPGGYWNLVDRIYHGFFEPLNDDDDDDNDDNDDDDNDDDDNDNDDDNDDNNDDDNDNDDNDNDDNDNDDDDNDDNDDNDDDNDDDDNDTDGDDDSADDDDDDNNDDDAAGGLDDDQAGDGLQASEDSADGCGC